jgi:hypothetical protein
MPLCEALERRSDSSKRISLQVRGCFGILLLLLGTTRDGETTQGLFMYAQHWNTSCGVE